LISPHPNPLPEGEGASNSEYWNVVHLSIDNPLSPRDDSRDGGGRTKFGTRVERVRVRG